jgi:hypothetical protein
MPFAPVQPVEVIQIFEYIIGVCVGCEGLLLQFSLGVAYHALIGRIDRDRTAFVISNGYGDACAFKNRTEARLALADLNFGAFANA